MDDGAKLFDLFTSALISVYLRLSVADPALLIREADIAPGGGMNPPPQYTKP
jgi:hypothetical protein